MEVRREVDIAPARWAAKELAASRGFLRREVYRFVTSVSELAGNLVFHTERGGRVVLAAVCRGRAGGVEVAAEDDGPGIPDVDLALRDGYSTRGTLGCGLPGVRRLMDELEIDSQVGRGTRVVARMWGPCR